MNKLPTSAISIDRQSGQSIDFTVWMCFQYGPFSPDCPRNCNQKIFKKCELNQIADDDVIAIESETDDKA